MPVYKNSPDGFTMVRKRTITKIVPLFVIAGAAGLFITWFNSAPDQPILYPILFTMCVLVCVSVFTMRNVLKQQETIYHNFELTIENDHITSYANGKTTTVYFNQIVKITEDSYGNLVVKGDKKLNIGVPALLVNYTEIRALLASKQTISRDSWIQRFQIPLTLGVIACMVAVYISTNKIIVGACGIVVVGTMCWGFYTIRTSPQIDAQTKRKSWWVLVAGISIAATIYFKIFGVM